ncbi:phage tail protein I [Roseospira visakhapatnamensis]|uniref:Phage tail P2-like protein n=1 Tax=Roseospira visakhapatnamensis TaxID=390880 RepID=A0A7W6REA6_9PROT|nr:phage tail protein I [Roseospira visakhapatnamensis]MBB4266888.1 phage tail P2-like protein [Roseospira visakhapatnamensis]
MSDTMGPDVTPLMPPNASGLERALDQVLARIEHVDLSPIRALKDPATCPAHLLPWLAWERSVDTWSATLTEAQRRAVIAAAPRLHRIKGTPAAIQLGLQAVGLADAEVVEGLPALRHDGEARRDGRHTYAGDRRWALFQIWADLGNEAGLDAVQVARIRAVIARAKNARSHLHALGFRANVHVVKARPDLDHLALAVRLDLRGRQGVRDGRFRRGGARLPDRGGAIAYDGSARRGVPLITETIRYHEGHLIPSLPVRVGLTGTHVRPPVLPRDGRLRFDGRAVRGRPMVTVTPAPVVIRRLLPRDGSFSRIGHGPRRDGGRCYGDGARRGGRHRHGLTIERAPA